MTHRYLAILLSLALLPLAGCSDDEADDSGVLVVPYELGNRRDCESLGVVAVRAELDEGQYVEETDCGAGQVRFNLLEPGSYDVAVYGLDEEGYAVMDSLVDGPQPIDVVGGNTTVVFDPAVQLVAAPAKLQMRWELGFGSCESTSIETFGIVAWRSDGSDLLMQAEVPCDMAGEGHAQYRLVPDIERELSGEEVGQVEIQPFDRNGIAIGDSVSFEFEAPGAGRSIKLSLNCNVGGCEGTGTPD